MKRKLKFNGWGREGEGLDEDERSRVFRFAAKKLTVEQSAAAAPPQASDIALRTPRISAPAALASVLTQDPHERLLRMACSESNGTRPRLSRPKPASSAPLSTELCACADT